MDKELELFRALCDETRFKIVKYLLTGRKCVCEIVEKVGRAQPTVSLQLSKLEELGVVKSRREGKKVYYFISNQKVKGLLAKKDFSKWKGLDRREIEWYPIIDENKCIGCGMCVTSCGRNVFSFDSERNKAIVANPYNCMVGCTTCSVYCLQDAISFPDKEYVRNLIRKHGLLGKAKTELLKMKE